MKYRETSPSFVQQVSLLNQNYTRQDLHAELCQSDEQQGTCHAPGDVEEGYIHLHSHLKSLSSELYMLLYTGGSIRFVSECQTKDYFPFIFISVNYQQSLWI